MKAPGFVPMAHALLLPSNTLFQVNSPWGTARVFPERLLNSKSPCSRQSLNTPRDFLHAKLDPTQHDTRCSTSFAWTIEVAGRPQLDRSYRTHLTSCALFPCQSGVMARPSCQVLTRNNTRNVVLMLLVLSKVGHIKPCSCRAMPRPAQPMPYPIQSCHFVPCNVSLAIGVYDAPSQCNANQPMLMARELSTPPSCRGTVPHQPYTLAQRTCARHLGVLFLL